MEHKRTWIYCRVAYPDARALASQQAALEAFAEKQGFEIAGTTAEQASGLDFSRRGLTEVSNAVDAGKVDLLLVANLSRFPLGPGRGKDGRLSALAGRSACRSGLCRWHGPADGHRDTA